MRQVESDSDVTDVSARQLIVQRVQSNQFKYSNGLNSSGSVCYLQMNLVSNRKQLGCLKNKQVCFQLL